MDEVTRIVLSDALAGAIRAAARAAYPFEACGLLIGRIMGSACVIERVAASANVAAGDKRREFEIDPKLQFMLMRELRGTDRDIVGVYHSHPNGAAAPSATDAARAFDRGFIWIIAGGAEIAAYIALGDVQRFRRLEIVS